MEHKERKLARRIDTPGRARCFTDPVYEGKAESAKEVWDRIIEEQKKFYPEPSEYNIYFGDIHGHSNLSDGFPTIDEYYRNLRDVAKLDFGALADHDHGGVGNDPLWIGKWDTIRQKAAKYNDPGKFTTMLAYERDSYPWYNNLVVYYDNYEGEMLRGEHDGEITREELHSYLKRDDLILVPHDTCLLSPGADFYCLEEEDMTPLIQIYSRGKHQERFDPNFIRNSDCEGGYWQDALKRGARMGVMASSDDHDCNNGHELPERCFQERYPGLTAVLAKENTLPAIFEALKARRCYALMGGKIKMDFRINGHYMGEEFTTNEDKTIYYKVEADAVLDTVTVVKNCRDYVLIQRTEEQVFFDYCQEQETDVYYLRVKLVDGRLAWSSPIWVNRG